MPPQVQKTKQTEKHFFQTLQEQEFAPFLQATQHMDEARAGEPAPEQQLTQPYSSLSKDQQKAEKKRYKEAKARNTFVPASYMKSSYMQEVLKQEVEIGDTKITQKELFDKVSGGDCSHMQQLDSVLRNRAATIWMTRHNPIQSTQTPEQFIAAYKYEHRDDFMTAVMNPLFRMGISCVMNSPDVEPEVAEKYRKIDELLNKEIMKATIAKRIPRGTPGYMPEEREDNVQKQVFIVKTMLACHLGRLKVKDSKKTPPVNEDWHGAVANAFAHCSRVMITLPGAGGDQYSSEKQEAMFRSFNKKDGLFERRKGATHTMSRKKKGSTGEAKEVKFFSPRSQYGMNVAVGGLGNYGIEDSTGRPGMLLNDGSCGHVFMHFEEGTKSKHAGMLIGFESDAYKKTNQTGHTHDKKATGEFVSSFGGQRCDEIGDKYGGRLVDLSGCDEVAFTKLMDMVDSLYTHLMMDETANHSMLEELSEKVCGNLMDQKDIEEFMQLLCASVYRYDLQGDAVDLVRSLHMPRA